MSEPSSVDEFARRLVETVRDLAIDSCDQLVGGVGRGVLGARWREQLGAPSAREAVSELIPDVVDQVLFHLLDAIDNGLLPLAWKRDGTFEDLADAGQGEMAGWLMAGKGGWIDQYSARRHFDPFEGLDENGG
jgi:hypothetical protein